MQERTYNKILAAVLIILLAVLLFYAVRPFLAAFIGALILYVVFFPVYAFFAKKMAHGLASGLVLVIGTVIILLPLSALIPAVVSQVNVAISNRATILAWLAGLDSQIPWISVSEQLAQVMTGVVNYLKSELGSILGSVTEIAVILIIMYFVLYYMFVNSTQLRKTFKEYMPFSKKHTEVLMQAFTKITNATVISTGIIALAQGSLMGLAFWIVGIPGALFWGFVGTILAFFPVVGIPLLWIPAGSYLIVSGDLVSGIGILVWGAILSNVDNFVRPVLQNKFGEIHPLTTLIGVFIGVPLFGILGLIIGPVLISFFFLLVRMYRAEFLDA